MADLPTIGGLVAVVVGILLVTAWALRLDPLRRLGMDVAPISLDSGIALLLAGLGILALSRPVGSSASRNGYLPLLALLGLAVLGAVRTLLGMDTGLTLLPSTLGAGDTAGQTAHAAPTVLGCCVLVSVALLLRTGGGSARLPGMLLAVALAIAWLTVLDLLLGGDVAILFGSTMRLAPGPAIALVLLCVGALAMLGPQRAADGVRGPVLDNSREDAARAADDIRVALEAIEVDLNGLAVRTTVSAGCAALEPGMTPADLLARADLALSMAKRAGRNTVVVA